MTTPREHVSLLAESSTVSKIIPFREVQTSHKKTEGETRKFKFMPRRLSEFEKELEQAKNEPLVICMDTIERSEDLLEELPENFDSSIEIDTNESSEATDRLASIEEDEEESNCKDKNKCQKWIVPCEKTTELKPYYSTPNKLSFNKTRCIAENSEDKENLTKVQASVPASVVKVNPRISRITDGIRQSVTVSNNFSTPKNCCIPISIKSGTRKTGNSEYVPRPGVTITDITKNINGKANSEHLERTIIVRGIEYIILRELGRGGSSVVYDCFDRIAGTLRAIKCVSLENNTMTVGYLNEVKLLQNLEKCDNIIKMFDYEINNSKRELLVVLERGVTDLSKLLKKLLTKQHLPMHKLMYYWMEMLYAVKQIHENGIVHCDLKPSNFIVDSDGGIKLIDFGISCSIQHDMTSAIKSVAEGSLNYISPESVANNSSGNPDSPSYRTPKYKINFKSDVWSLGCILYQFVYRRTPFQHIGHMYAKVSAIMDPCQKIEYPDVNTVPKHVIDTVKRCLQYHSKNRPSIDELIQEYQYSKS